VWNSKVCCGGRFISLNINKFPMSAAEYQPVSVSNEREVAAEDLTIEQLSNLKQQHEDEIKELSSQLDQLFGAKNRYINARNVLDDMNKSSPGAPMLVPLTSSLYAPGKVQDPNKVIVELGTGYFVEKTIPDAKDLISRKVGSSSLTALISFHMFSCRPSLLLPPASCPSRLL
jgi:prefoldin alpha subunit